MLDGRTAYETYHRLAASGSVTPFGDLSAHGRERWQRVEEAIRLEAIKPIAGWREADAEDPHGKRYECRRQQLAGGHLTDDQAAWAVAMADRNDPDLEGVLAVARDRIRWLSRTVAYLEQSVRRLTERALKAESMLEATVRDATGMREELALRASKITALEADRDALEHRRRWNVTEGQDGSVLICQNLHAKHEPCDYIEYVPAERLERLQAERTLPPFGLPSGSLQAYSDAYKAAYAPERKHIDGHIAGLRAVLEHFPEGARELEELQEACEACNGTGIDPNRMLLSQPPKPAKCDECGGTGIAPEPTPYTVLATIYDGTQILAPATLSDRYSHDEISAAIKDVVARARGPRSRDMADVVDAINGEGAR